MHNMDPSVATSGVRSKDPHLPPLVRVGDLIAPKAPNKIAAAGLEEGFLTDLVVKLASTVARFSTDWVMKRLHLTWPLVSEIMELLCREGLVEETLKSSETRSHYKISEQGREHALRLMEVCRYIGPPPVSLKAYTAMLRWQFANTPQVLPEHVATALSSLVLSQEAERLAGLAVS